MKIFKYSYLSKDKKIKKRKIKAPDETLCMVYLKNLKINVVELHESNTFIDKLSLINIGRTIKDEELIFILKNLSVLLESGLRIPNAIEIIIKQSRSQNVKSIMLEVYFKVLEGESLSQAMSHFDKDFPKIITEIINSGEKSSNLVNILKTSAEYIENKKMLKQDIFLIFKNPLLYILLASGVSTFLLVTVFPVYKDLYDSLNASLPTSLRIFFIMSDIYTKHYIIIILLFLLFVIFVILCITNEYFKSKIDVLKLKVPIVKRTTMLYYQSYISTTMSELINSKKNILDSLILTRPTIENRLYYDLISKMINYLFEGRTLSEAIEDTSLLDEIFIKMVSVSEISGNTSYCFNTLRTYFDQIVFIEIKRLRSRIEPILMIGVYLFVVLLILAVMIPSLSIMTQV